MRKRNIKTIAHWCIMGVLLLFPVLMVGVSAFANDEQTTTVTESYEYETNEVNSSSDLIVGHIYRSPLIESGSFQNPFAQQDVGVDGIKVLNRYKTETLEPIATYSAPNTSFNADYCESNEFNGVLSMEFDDENDVVYNCSLTLSNSWYLYYIVLDSTNLDWTAFTASDYLGELTTTVDIQSSNYKQEVNNWANGFKNLPVNAWYNNLLNVIGIGSTTNSVMNVIYVYPLYVMWVYILDLIVDCILLIINLGHNALKKLSGDVE